MTTLATPETRKTTAGPRRSTASLRIAYLTTEYPKVSHTFIRREILALEELGHHVTRLAIRDSGGAIADDLDRAEYEKTFHCLRQSPIALVAGVVRASMTSPGRMMRAVKTMWSMHRKSTRGLARHLAYLAEAVTLRDRLLEVEAQHLHVHFGTNAAAVARLIRVLGGPPYSMMIHGPGEYDDPRGFDLHGKCRDAAFVTTISDYCSAQLRRWADVDDWPRIRIVRCPVAEHFLEAAQPVSATSNTFVCVGRLTPQKGQILLIDAVHQLVQDGHDIHLVLAGDGEFREAIERRVRETSLHDHVTITGWVDEATVRAHLLEARALVLPSFAEGLPVVIMEALALGRPCISTQVAAIPELVRQGETGWLIPPANVHALTEALRGALTTDAATLSAMGERGQSLVRSRHRALDQAARLASLVAASIDGDALPDFDEEGDPSCAA